MTPADLIAEYNKIRAFIEAENKRFAEHLKPHNERLQEINNQLLALMNEQRVEAFKTDEGTAYKSVLVTPKVTDKLAWLDWCLEDWDGRGAMMQIGAPQKEALKDYQQEHEGHLPPFVETSAFTRINIRKS